MDLDFMRYCSLDMIRGLAIVSMLFVNTLTFLSSSLPLFLQHNTGGMLPADLIAPLFQFILGVSLVISVNKRKERGESVWKHVLKRGLLLILIGLVLDWSTTGFQELKWGILQSLGIGLVMGYLFISMSGLHRAIVAVVILLGYSALVEYVPWVAGNILGNTHGGPLGAISYGTVTIFGTIAGTWFYDKKERPGKAMAAGFGLMVLSGLTNTVIPFNRLIVSSSYMLFSAGICFVIMALFYILGEQKKKDIKVLGVFGRNALSLWIAQYIFFYLPLIYSVGGCCYLPAYLGFAGAVIVLPVYYVMADVLEWKGIRIPI